MTNRPVDSDEELMTLEEWRAAVESGGFIDYDGFGDLATDKEVSDVEVVPSDVESGRLDRLIAQFPHFTHVAWYNK